MFELSTIRLTRPVLNWFPDWCKDWSLNQLFTPLLSSHPYPSMLGGLTYFFCMSHILVCDNQPRFYHHTGPVKQVNLHRGRRPNAKLRVPNGPFLGMHRRWLTCIAGSCFTYDIIRLQVQFCSVTYWSISDQSIRRTNLFRLCSFHSEREYKIRFLPPLDGTFGFC